ncbi:MAG: ribosome biogenesis GTPase Der [Arenicellales bacterium]
MEQRRDPVIAIVGRPNVGKSTLFNRLTRSRDAIVDDQSGVTRDRIMGRGRHGAHRFRVVDTGGLDESRADDLSLRSREQVRAAVEESDVVILLMDAREGLTHEDREIAQWLRRVGGRVYPVANKAEGLDDRSAAGEFYELGLGDKVFEISSRRGTGLAPLMDSVLEGFAENTEPEEVEGVLNIGVVGRPNVGKSTLINRLLGDDRLLVQDSPGTTRDRVKVSWTYEGEEFCLIDTAGVRRRPKVQEKIEKFSVVKSLATIDESHVVVLVLDAQEGIVEQDARLAGLIRAAGRSMVLAVNKWDGLGDREKSRLRRELDRKLPFLDEVDVLFVSAKHGTNVGLLMPAVKKAADSAMVELNTSRLNRVLQKAVELQPPPMVGRRHIKLKYAHQGGKNPPTIVIHGSLVHKISPSYRRYLCAHIRRGFGLHGTPVALVMKPARNPFVEGG